MIEFKLTRDSLRHNLCVLIFGLVIPTMLFMLAYPGGPSDMINRVKYEWTIGHNRNVIDITLPNVFTESDPAYLIAVQSITMAPAGSVVHVNVEENFGGSVGLLLALKQAMHDTKATVIVSLDKFGLSCGTMILQMGDYLVLNNDTLLLTHLGSYGGVRLSLFSDDPQIRYFAETTYKLFRPYIPWVTSKEYQKITHGGDVFFTGESVCKGQLGRKADILFTFNNGCVIKGKGRNAEVWK